MCNMTTRVFALSDLRRVLTWLAPRSPLQATADGGLLVIHSQQGLGWGSSNWSVEGGQGSDGGTQGSTALRKAVTALHCGENNASAAVGDLDGCDD